MKRKFFFNDVTYVIFIRKKMQMILFSVRQKTHILKTLAIYQ